MVRVCVVFGGRHREVTVISLKQSFYIGLSKLVVMLHRFDVNYPSHTICM